MGLLICPIRFCLDHVTNPLMNNIVQSRWLGIDLILFLVFMQEHIYSSDRQEAHPEAV